MQTTEPIDRFDDYSDIIITKSTLVPTGLRKFLQTGHVWLLAIAPALFAAFTVWNSALAYVTPWQLFGLFFVLSIFYVMYCFILTKMNVSYPLAGGAYAYTRRGLGKFWGFANGVFNAAKYLCMAAVVLRYMELYLSHVLGIPYSKSIVVILFCLLAAVQCSGIKATAYLQLFMTYMAISLFLLFYLGANADSILASEVNALHREDYSDLMRSLPYVLWIFLGLDVITVSTEEIRLPYRTVPKSNLISTTITILLFLMVLYLSSTVISYHALAGQRFPLLFVLREIQGRDQVLLQVFALLGIFVFLAALNSLLNGLSRITFSLGRAGYISAAIGNFSQKGKAPLAAIVLSGCFLLVLAEFAGIRELFLSACIFGILSYLLILLSYLRILTIEHGKGVVTLLEKIVAGITAVLCVGILFVFLRIAMLQVLLVFGFLAMLAISYLIYIKNHVNFNAPEEVDASAESCGIKITYL